MINDGKKEQKVEPEQECSVAHARCKIAAGIIYAVAVMFYLIVTAYFTVGFIQAATQGGGLAGAFITVFLIIFGIAAYSICFALDLAAFIAVNVTHPTKRIVGVRYIVAGGLAVVTFFIFFIISVA